MLLLLLPPSPVAAPGHKPLLQAREPCCVHTMQVLNVDNVTAAPSVLLFFDKDRYLFNAGEGIQRHFIEHKQRLKKVMQLGHKLVALSFECTQNSHPAARLLPSLINAALLCLRAPR